ncbi:hypothetical protein ABZ615_17205 [Streptomyces sp. NPDC007325]|uniref:hypothetical protein n=1 Tax=Streptomyces sp. NPDC007325 TaxID=3154588 RepID=UPI0033C8ECBB
MTIMANTRTAPLPVLGTVLIAVGVLAPVAQLVGAWVAEATRYVVLLGAFGAAWPYWLAGFALCGAGVLRTGVRRPVRQAVAVACAAGAVLVVFFRLVLFDVLGAGWEETQRVPAPGGAERAVRVEQGAAMIDPLWRVSVVEGSGLTARSHEVATYGEPTGFHAVAWDGPDALLVTDGDGTKRITLDPSTGAPDRTVDAG